MDRLLRWLAHGLMAWSQRLPRRRALSLGRRAGRLAACLFPRRRSLVRRNLRRAYRGEKREAELAEIARLNFEHYGQCAAEFLRIPMLTAEDLAGTATFHGLEHLRAVQRGGRGGILLLGHSGNWDLMAVAQALAGFGAHVITKEIRYPALNEVWMEVRRARGVQFLAASESAFALVRLLKRGGLAAIVLDQHRPRAQGIQTRFFGRPVSTMPVAAVLALRLGCPVLPVEGWRDERGHHQFVVHPQVPLVRGADDAASVTLTTQAFNDVLEAMVRRHPEQWTWIHRRWKRHRAPAPPEASKDPAPASSARDGVVGAA